MSDREQHRGQQMQTDLSPAVETFVRQARAGLSLPIPGHGRTSQRFSALRAQAGADASVGRLFEAHTDAIAILFEACVRPPSDAALAVWASGPTSSARLEPKCDRFVLNGKRAFCGGATIVDAALLTVESPDGERLVLVDLKQAGVAIDPGIWKSESFRDAGISTVHFDNVHVDAASLIGPPGWYGGRLGFWFGAVGVAALWAGMADSILASLPALRRRCDDIALVATGSIEASMWAVSALLDQAASQMDATSALDDRVQRAKSIALCGRHTVRTHVESAIAAFDQEVGPAALAFDPDLARKRTELSMALAQTHGARDLIVLAQDEHAPRARSV